MRITGWSVLLALGIFAGADGRAAAQAVNTEASIVYYDMAGNATLDPAEPQNNSTYSHEALLAIYDTLIRLDDAGVPGPGLADSWTRNDDLTELTLHIRPGVMFHDGTPVNAEAVRRNFERSTALGKRAGSAVAETFALVSSFEVVGTDSIKLKLKAPNGQIEYWLGGTAGMMISPASFKDDAFGGTLNAVCRTLSWSFCTGAICASC